MKHTAFFYLLFVTSSSVAQNDKFSLGIQSGYDYYSKSTHGWNIGAFGQRTFNEGSKWFHECGISYSEREYNYSGDVVFDTSETSIYQMIMLQQNAEEEYRKESYLRFQAGVGRTIYASERQKFSIGMDLGISWEMSRKGHGQYVHFQYDYTNTTVPISGVQVLAYSYASSKPQLNSLLEFLPYINHNVKINNMLSFNARLTGLYPFFENPFRKLQTQLNVGLYYSF